MGRQTTAAATRHYINTPSELRVHATSLETLYVCPGETHPISRSVHLSRLAAFYPKCRECPLRKDTGHLASHTVEAIRATERRVHRPSLLTPDGVRGVYLNELNRQKAAQYAGALASQLWEDNPLIGRAGTAKSSGRRSGPLVIVGHDERPSAPDIVTGVAEALRLMGCQVVDVGAVTTPCLWFAVNHLNAAAGILVTGQGSAWSTTGLDIVGRHASPYSHPGQLDGIEQRAALPLSRPTRRAAAQRTFQAFVPYEAGLWKHFHALRPLTICCACPTLLVRRTLERLFDKLPCRLSLIDVPQRVRDLGDPDDPDARRVSAAVIEQRAHLGVLIDDDGCRAAFFDEQGELFSSETLLQLIVGQVLAEHPGGAIVVEDSAVATISPIIESAGGVAIPGGSTRESLSRAMHDTSAVYGGGASGRFWQRDPYPTCDAILALSRILGLLSQSDTPFSAFRERASVSGPPAAANLE